MLAHSVQQFGHTLYRLQRTVITHPKFRNTRSGAAFTLIEMVAVIAILATLMTAGINLLNGTGAQSRRAGTDMLSGMIEQARTRAITSRSNILLVIAEPGALPTQDERCRIGMFKVEDNWLENPAAITNAQLLKRWQTLNTGIVLLPGDGSEASGSIPLGVPNPLGNPNPLVSITYGGSKNLNVKAYVIGFNSRGSLTYPTGSTPIAIRIAEGGYRGGKASANKGPDNSVTESRLKIGRVTARPYQID